MNFMKYLVYLIKLVIIESVKIKEVRGVPDYEESSFFKKR
jgi:hypothetical protein